MENIQKENWNRFVLENGGSFLQSYEWGEFQESVGWQVSRLSGDRWQTQFIRFKLPGVNKFYWYCPRGPILANSQLPIANSEIQEIIKQVKKIAGNEVVFFRLGPEWELAKSEWIMANGFKQLSYDIEPSQTLILDITKTEEELLAQMHEKWRYNIHLAERKGVKINMVFCDDAIFEKYFEEFYRLVDQGTSERKEIKHHPKEYYRKQLKINSQQLKFILFVAEYENRVVAANIIVLFGKKAIYLHGATDNSLRNVMAPHLLQWEQIKYAKAQNYTEYDFWGVVNEHTLDKRGQSWEGFTRFKKGFGGQEMNYVGYFDYPLNKNWYFLYRLIQKFRR